MFCAGIFVALPNNNNYVNRRKTFPHGLWNPDNCPLFVRWWEIRSVTAELAQCTEWRQNGFLCEIRSHYYDVIVGAITSLITSLLIVYSTVYSDTDQRKHQSSTPLAFVWGIHRGPHKWQVMRKMFPFDDVIMVLQTGINAGGKNRD